jgi:hypothetical protein
MGRIMTKGPLGELNFTKLKAGQVYKGCEVVRITETCVIIKTSQGSFAIGGPQRAVTGHYSVINWGADDFSKSVLDGIVRIGAVTKDDVDRHVNAIKERRKRESEARKLKYAKEALTELGLSVPKALEKRLAACGGDA